jgi:3-deoxy-manno-octulosonate cytidylyltransferase (CMP-KDO synthetase)
MQYSTVAMIPPVMPLPVFRETDAKTGDKTVIRHTYDATLATGLFNEVIVVTDSDTIYDEITRHGGKGYNE